jgi:transposase InsO family protein
MAAQCREFGVSRQTGYTWLKRYEEGGGEAVLSERSRRPHHSPRKAPAEIEEAIKRLRMDKPDWGARKLLAVILGERPELAANKISVTTAHRILDREHLIAPEDRHKPAVQRFERKEPNELWQMDFKGPQGFNKGSGPLSIQDDFSRFLLVLQQLDGQKLKSVKARMAVTFEDNGLPEFLLIDHGTPWYNNWSPWGWTELTVWLMRQGIRIILCGVRHPQTQGKVERMHGALQRAIRKRSATADLQSWLDEFRYEYNHVRPHEGIGMVTPASRWQPSPRRYQPNPKEWEYPSNWEVHRLEGEGRLQWQGKRWEISWALRGQTVGLQQTGSRVLVHFCNVALREIDLRTGRNVVLPVSPLRDLQI